MNDKNQVVEDVEFVIPEHARAIDQALNQINQMMLRDQPMMVEGALMYIATAIVHSAGDPAKNAEAVKELLDKYVRALTVEHADCIAQLQAEGTQLPTHTH